MISNVWERKSSKIVTMAMGLLLVKEDL